ncbi:MAG: AAA family ATPase [Candidatus Micrarchaeota archaeon]
MIRSVELRNWRSHETSRLEFGKGTNILVGIMGSGKSSVLEGICFALFGTFPALQHKRIKIGDVVSRRARGEGAEVEVGIDVGGKSYTVKRKIKQSEVTEAEIRGEGKLIEGPQQQRVTEYVEKLLKVDYELFARAIYSEQNRIDYILNLGRGERKKQIDELLGISRFEDARAGLSKVLNRIKEVKEEKGRALKETNLEQIEAEVRRGEEAVKKMEGAKEELARELAKLGEERKGKEEAVRALEAKSREFRALAEKKAGVNHTLESLRADIAKAVVDEKEADRLRKESEELKKEIEKLRGEARANEREIKAGALVLGNVQRKLEELGELLAEKKEKKEFMEVMLSGRTLDELKLQMEEKRRRVEDETEKLAALRSRASEIKSALAELEKDITKCPVCESPLTEERRAELRLARGKEMEKILGELRTAEKGLGERRKEARELEEIKTRVEPMEERLRALRNVESETEKNSATLASTKKGIEEKEKLIEKREGEAGALEEKKKNVDEKLSGVSGALDKKVKARKLEDELRALEKMIGELRFEESALERARKEGEEARVRESGLREKSAGVEREAAPVRELLEERRKRLAEMRRYADEIKSYEGLIENLLIFQNSVVETQHVLRTELVEAINSAMGEIWGVVYPYADYTSIRLRADEKDYELELGMRDGVWLPVDGMASGGERACACLALRIAFATVLVPNLSWLILDEPTHNLDEDGVKAIARALYEQIPKIVEQTFVITHDENLRDAASAKLYEIKRNKEEDGGSAVELVT